MYNKLKLMLKKGGWYSLAMIIVMLAAGPEILISMELMAVVEMLGASTFVLAYWSGIKLRLEKPIAKFKQFERHSILFLPSREVLKQMPSMLIHAVPERTFTIAFVGFYTLFLMIFLASEAL